MADGGNWLLLGMALVWTVYFLFHAREQMIATLSGILGSLTVLFAFNWRGKLFMGNCGLTGRRSLGSWRLACTKIPMATRKLQK